MLRAPAKAMKTRGARLQGLACSGRNPSSSMVPATGPQAFALFPSCVCHNHNATSYCVAEGACSKGDVVRCAWTGGHDYYGRSRNINSGRLVWEFLQRWARPCHLGGGEVDADGGCVAVLLSGGSSPTTTTPTVPAGAVTATSTATGGCDHAACNGQTCSDWTAKGIDGAKLFGCTECSTCDTADKPSCSWWTCKT
jgi:hypothetical protein